MLPKQDPSAWWVRPILSTVGVLINLITVLSILAVAVPNPPFWFQISELALAVIYIIQTARIARFQQFNEWTFDGKPLKPVYTRSYPKSFWMGLTAPWYIFFPMR